MDAKCQRLDESPICGRSAVSQSSEMNKAARVNGPNSRRHKRSSQRGGLTLQFSGGAERRPLQPVARVL